MEQKKEDTITSVGILIFITVLVLAALCLAGCIVALFLFRPVLAALLFLGFIFFTGLAIVLCVLWLILRAFRAP